MTLKVEISIQMTGSVVDVVAVTVTIVFRPHYIPTPFFLFHLKYVEQKRKEISPKGGGPPTKSIKSSIKISWAAL